MIAKIKTGNYFKGALKYNMDKIGLDKAVSIGSFGFKTEEPTFEEVLAKFQRMAKIHPMAEPVAHISVSFAPGEHFENEKLIEIAHEYMQRMGFGRTPYAIFRHDDTFHQHIHIVSANITINAKGRYQAIADSNNYYRNKRICADMERKYGLVIADKKKCQPRKEFRLEEPQAHHYGDVPTFDYLRTVGNYILNKRLFVNLYELNQFLLPYSIAVFFNTSRRGEKYYKLTFINKEKRESIGIGGAPKKLKMEFTSQNINDLFLENRQKLKTFLQEIRSITSQWVKDNYSMSLTDIEKRMQKLGLSCVSPGIYCNVQDGRQFNLHQLGIPNTFVKSATVSREYFKAFVRTVTAFRRVKGIFYESSMLKDYNMTGKLRSFAKMNLSTLSKAQVNVLTDGYLAYKLKQLPEIEIKERQKDIAWINKLIDYIRETELKSYEDQIFFLRKLGIEIKGEKIILHNTIDDVVHILDKSDVTALQGAETKKSIFITQIERLNDKEWKAIKTVINGKFEYLPGVDYKILTPFLPSGFITQLSRFKQNYIQKNINRNIISALIPDRRDMYSGKLLKWDDENDEDDENESKDIKKRRRRL